ncbi:preprotein translocase subunit SecA [uncultured Clostridium sp.]|jgi:preprotein translocase subunit SecA|uniref:preprotein translocase subunit SecA n=1 Tax=uncultured Clostridium sp. TaxID=59620 RepID=UPI0026244F09|nr:preprotein translocase subunit SecA [uncultured Clostridium sp.]
MGFLDKIFGSYSERQVKKIIPVVDQIDALVSEMEKLSEDELRGKTQEFRDRLEKGETLNDLLVEAFAVVREAARRQLGMSHYREQMIGGIVLHQGRIAEMKTGEGKTLVGTLPVYLNALSGKGVHVITVNDYLASRDREQMATVYEYLGLTTGVIVHGLNNDQRRESYNADITYGTNNEFGFDYLRDNMVIYKEERVQRKLNYCVVDEVDSILIDEARTPLIISGQGEKSTDFYKIADFFVKRLKVETHFTVDEKGHAVMLTDEGIVEAEKAFNVENYADADNMQLQHYITQGLKANHLMKLDKDYMVKDDEIIIVDEFTGRLMEGRRYSDGLHQAIEAKEGVKIKRESKTLATITFQNYFRMYDKLSGMTGTALTEENEFRDIYSLDVVVIPTHRPIQRLDQKDLVYKNQKGKYLAIVEDIIETNRKGQPVLVGTTSIEKSEIVSGILKQRGIGHKVLNAKYHEQEAEIVSRAGEYGRITIATNMAGRGTDIKLGEGVIEAGGLKIIGTERHESRRIDNQLRGRAGRQGDPGESRFYVSLEDDLMRLFGSDRVISIADKLGLADDEAIENGMVTKTIENAQKKVEGNNFDIRKSLLGYDDVINKQREIIYKQRTEVLEGEDLKASVIGMINSIVEDSVALHLNEEDDEYENSLKLFLTYLEDVFLEVGVFTVEMLKNKDADEVLELIRDKAHELYEAKEGSIGSEQMREIERVILLKIVDTKWMDHIDNMDHLKQGIGLMAYKQQDPVQAYQQQGSDMFIEMIDSIQNDTVKYLYHVRIQSEAPQREQVAQEVAATHGGDNTPAKKEPVRSEKMTGRNEACPCGSGKKYKNCCGREVV